VSEPKIRLETLLLKSGMKIGVICKKAGIAPRMLYELRHRNYQTPPITTAVGKLAKVLGVTRVELMRMVCANSPAGRILAAQEFEPKGNSKAS
jgi:xanthosine utilization system XapX-like protein